jgi:hypothetical protein
MVNDVARSAGASWGVHPIATPPAQDYVHFHKALPAKRASAGKRKTADPAGRVNFEVNEGRSCIERWKGDSMRQNGSFGILVFVIIAGLGGGLALLANSVAGNVAAVGIGVVTMMIAMISSAAIRVADQWDRAVILRLGKFHALKGPGLFFLIPVVDSIPYWIDLRVITTGFKAEKTLTKDTVPVDVDAVLFWKVVDPKKAALDVADYQSAISWASQTALRDVIGKTMLSDMLEGRDQQPFAEDHR